MPGKVAFIFDDGYASAYADVAPLFEARGLRCGFAVGSRLRFASITEGQVLDLQERGHEILNHGRTHQNLSAADSNTYLARDEVVESLEELEALGVSVRSYVAANSVLAEPHIVAHLAPTHLAGFTVYRDASGAEALQAVPLDPLRMHRTPLQTVGIDGARATIDAAVAADGLVVFYDHDPAQTQYANSMPLAQLAQVLDYCAASGVSVVLPSDAIEAAAPSRRTDYERGRQLRMMYRRPTPNRMPDPGMASLSAQVGAIWRVLSGAPGKFTPSGPLVNGLSSGRLFTITDAKKNGSGGFVIRNDKLLHTERGVRAGPLCFSVNLRSDSIGVNDNFEVILGIYARNAVGDVAFAAATTGRLHVDSFSRRYFVALSVPAVGYDVKVDCFVKITPIKTSAQSCAIAVTDARIDRGIAPGL